MTTTAQPRPVSQPPSTTATTPTKEAWWFLGVLVVELSSPGEGPVVMEATLTEGASPPLHVHHDLDDSFYVLDGRMVVRCGDDVRAVTAGDWVAFPSGVPHSFRVMGGPARVLMVHADDSFVQVVHDIGRPAEAVELPQPGGGPGLEELGRALAAHEISNVGPSMSEEEAQAFLVGSR